MTDEDRAAALAKRNRRERMLRFAWALLALGLLGYGLFRIFPPLAFVVVGGLLWLDLVQGAWMRWSVRIGDRGRT